MRITRGSFAHRLVVAAGGDKPDPYACSLLDSLIKDLRQLRTDAREAMPGKHAATVEEGIEVGKLLGTRATLTDVILDLQNLRSKAGRGLY